MSALDLDTEPVIAPSELEPEPPAPEIVEEGGWRRNKAGKQYVARPGGSKGVIFRRGEETVEQAIDRDRQDKDKPPRRRQPKAPKMPDAPKPVSLQELEVMIAEALKSPALICATFGDEWAAEHFTTTGPYLARNLILASEHNPWLRQKLEQAATGQDAAMKLVSLVGVGGALFTYVIPPVIYWLNVPVPDRTRQMFGIPPRRERPPEYAVGPDQHDHHDPFRNGAGPDAS